MSGKRSKYYAVRDGRETGIYKSWDECREQTNGYPRNSFKSFNSEGEARDFMRESVPRHPETRAQVYTDGGCSYNGQPGARGAYENYWGHNDPRNVSEPVQGRQTSNSAKIQAVTRAVEDAKGYGYDKVDVYTDSKFVKQGADDWMPKWKQNDWTTVAGHEVKNRSDFEALDRASSDIDVNIQYVPGHSGNLGNEAADELARSSYYR